MNLSGRSLRGKIILSTVLTLLIIQSFFSFIRVKDDFENSRKRFEDEVGRIIHDLNRSVTTPLWNYEYTLAEELIKNKLERQILVSVDIKDLSTEDEIIALFEKGKKKETDKSSSDKYSRRIETNAFHNGEALWKIGYTFTEKYLYRSLRSQIKRSVVRLLLLILIPSLILLFLINKIVLKPLKSMQFFIKDVEEHNELTKRMTIVSRDETSVLMRGFNDFLKRLNSTLFHTQSLLERVSVSNRDIKDHFEKTREGISEITEETTEIEKRLSKQSDKTDLTKRALENQKMQTAALIEKIEKVKQQSDRINSVTEEQSSAISEMSATIEEQASNINTISRNTKNTSEKLQSIASFTESNKKSITKTSSDINKMVENIDSIRDFADLISDIAGQTNLLAMNAAIEAAHAGEAGKGFAVVAEEIRKLADRSNDETEKVKKLLETFISYTQSARNSFETSNENYTSMTESIAKAAEMTSQISGALEEQENGNHEMLKAVKSIQEITGALNQSQNELNESSEGMNHFALDFKKVSSETVETFQALDAISKEINVSIKNVALGTKGMSAEIAENSQKIETLQSEIASLNDILSRFITSESDNEDTDEVAPFADDGSLKYIAS